MFDRGLEEAMSLYLSWGLRGSGWMERFDPELNTISRAAESDYAKACPSKEFACRNGKCVSPIFVCDGDDDCGDSSDEEKCSAPTCGQHDCDGDPDCKDKSDESMERCSRRTEPQKPRCPVGEFQCGSGECVHMNWKCDGDADCKDKSDEENCLTKCDGPKKFRCKNGECIDSTKVCDHVKDCKDWSDEPMKECGVNECADHNGGCSHICRDRRIGYECDCPPGYKLLDKKTCGDIDECENPDACSQVCVNYKGDFKCECYEGFEMDPVSKACKAVGKSPYLMFTNRHEIRRIDLLKSEYTQVVPTLKNAVALDVDVSSNKMFWCDLFHQKIYSAYINKASESSEQVTLIDSLNSPEGLAVDWVHKNIYWTDSGNKSISVATVDGRKRKVLIARNLSNRRLYWVDSKLHLLSSVDLNGDNRKVLLSSTDHLGHPFALTVFEDRIYWTDVEDEAIYSVNRLTGHDVAKVAEHLNNPLDLVVFHEQRQPQAASDHYLIGNNITVAVLGIVIPIVPILATVVIGLLCTGGYLVWRNWRRKNTKSMNFDNPVYRKTTEDDDDEIHIGRHSESIGHVYPPRVALSLEDDGYP
ncbi:hypothetical protein WMY93_025469 [Mugilogobius chulae]|uniref:EGF-like domain-containing protein n=1 Tax=Mugilogobius chulae TaxID=88201 RepID=A0AAW0N828_9GOBI